MESGYQLKSHKAILTLPYGSTARQALGLLRPLNLSQLSQARSPSSGVQQATGKDERRPLLACKRAIAAGALE